MKEIKLERENDEMEREKEKEKEELSGTFLCNVRHLGNRQSIT